MGFQLDDDSKPNLYLASIRPQGRNEQKWLAFFWNFQVLKVNRAPFLVIGVKDYEIYEISVVQMEARWMLRPFFWGQFRCFVSFWSKSKSTKEERSQICHFQNGGERSATPKIRGKKSTGEKKTCVFSRGKKISEMTLLFTLILATGSSWKPRDTGTPE